VDLGMPATCQGEHDAVSNAEASHGMSLEHADHTARCVQQLHPDRSNIQTSRWHISWSKYDATPNFQS